MAGTQSAADFLAQGSQQSAGQAVGASQSPEAFLAEGAPAGFNAAPLVAAGAPQNTSWTRAPAMLASALAKGATSLLGLPGDLEQLGTRFITNPLAAMTGVRPDIPYTSDQPGGPVAGEYPGLFPTSTELQRGTNALGLTDRSELAPQNSSEKYASAVASGTGTGLAAAASGGLALLPAVASGVAGNTAGEAAHEALPESRWAPVVAGVAAGLGVGGLSSAVARSFGASKAVKALEDAQEALDAAHKSRFYGGENARLAADKIKDASAAALEAKKQLIETVQGDAAKATQAHFDSTAAGLGESSTLQQAGQSLQAEARNWLSATLPAKLKETWAPVDAAIPPDMKLELGNFESSLKAINKSAGELEPLATLLKPAIPKKLATALDPRETLEDLIAETPKGQQQFSWQDVSKLRTTLGDALHNPQTIKDVGAENLDRLYASLTGDMSAAADRAGAGDLFNQANTESRRLYQIGEGPIARLVAGAKRSAEDPNPESVAASLLSGGKKGASDLQMLRDEIPAGVDELAAAHLRTAGPGVQGWGKLAPETQAALVPNPQTSAVLNSSLASRAQAEANAERELLAARRDHAETSESAGEALRTGNFSRSEQVMLAQDAVARAKAGLPPRPNPIVNLRHTIESGIGGALGWDFAPSVLAHLGVQSNPLALGAASAAGLALPYAGRALKAAIKSPGKLAPAAIAGAAGGNPLTLRK